MVVSAIAGPAGAAAAAASASDHQASVTFSEQTSGGSTVVVDEVTLPEGGFVTIHDASLADGNVLGSVVGTSQYLEAGTHENVTVELTDEVDDGTFHAMAHQDTDDDRQYTFVSSNGEVDGPYTTDGDIVMDDANVTVSASVSFSEQVSEGEYVIVDRVELSEGGFVTVHDSSLLDGATFDSIRGTSEYLEAGVHEDVRVQIDEPLENDDTLVPMAHRDTNDNQQYDFPSTDGEEDGPFTADGEAVLDSAQVELSDEAYVQFDAQASGGNAVVVEEVYLPEGGFVTAHDSSLGDGAVFDSIRGTSEYLEPGIHRDIVVTLDDPLTEDDSVFAMAHQDTNDNEAYDFPDSEGEDDGPYTNDDQNPAMDDGNVTVSAAVQYEGGSADGYTVTVDRVDLSEGGFVTVHDASLGGGAVFESIRGTSEYLEPGVHEDVEVTLDEPVRDTSQLFAMAHQDTNDNEAYDFPDSEGEDDGPYTANGDIVMDAGTAQVTAFVATSAQETDGETIVVDEVTLHDGGFVTVHDSTLADGAVLDSVRGTSEYLGPGTHEDVEIALDDPLTEDDTVFAMAHRDTDGDETYDFLTSEGADDGPYVAAGGPVMVTADASVAGGMDGGDETTDEETEDMTEATEMMDAETETMNETGDDAPGFGVAVALVALLAAALVAVRRD
nr:PGF-CTERM sorting domain-containing protein [Haloparvum sedimenti]